MKCLVFLCALVLAASMVHADVTYMGKDTATQGNWSDLYGNDGAILFALEDMTDMMTIGTFDDGGNQRWDWENPTEDVRGLLYLDGSGDRTGSCIFNNPVGVLTVETSLQDYQVAVYMVDWDSSVRIQDVVGYQGDTPPADPDATVENPEFHEGVYHLWHVTGDEPFKLQVTHQGGANWVLSGLFVDDTSNGTAVEPHGKTTTTWGRLKQSQ